MFDFTVKYFGALKRVPLLPAFFDALLKIQTFIKRPGVLDLIDQVEQEVMKWENVSTSLHRFGGLQFNHNGREIGHVHSNGLLDILFTREIKEALIRNGRAGEHHIFKDSGWISFFIRTQEDFRNAIELLKLSYSYNAGKTLPITPSPHRPIVRAEI